jgi:hypothetical protein
MIIPDEDEHIRKNARGGPSSGVESRSLTSDMYFNGPLAMDTREARLSEPINDLQRFHSHREDVFGEPPSYEETLLLRNKNISSRACDRFVRTLIVAVLVCVLVVILLMQVIWGLKVRSHPVCYNYCLLTSYHGPTAHQPRTYPTPWKIPRVQTLLFISSANHDQLSVSTNDFSNMLPTGCFLPL